MQHLPISYCETAFSLLKIHVAVQHFSALWPVQQAVFSAPALLFCHRRQAARLVRYHAALDACGMIGAARGGLMTAAALSPVCLPAIRHLPCPLFSPDTV